MATTSPADPAAAAGARADTSRGTEQGPTGERDVRQRLRLALEAAALGVWDWDLASERLSWDRRCAAMFGLPEADDVVSTATVDRAVHPDDRARVLAARRGAETGAPVDVEVRTVAPDGAERLVLVRGQVLPDAAGAPTRLVGVTLDVTDYRRESAQHAQDVARMAGLVAAAQQLGDAASEADVLDVVTQHGTDLLGVAGTALCLLDGAGGDRAVRTLTTSFVPEPALPMLSALPADYPMPMVRTALTGRACFLADRAEAEALVPGAGQLYALSGVQASAAVPLQARGATVGALTVAFAQARAWRPADRELLVAFAALTAQALERIAARAERAAAAEEVARMSQTLQRSLLTEPPEPDHVQVVVRYRPASAIAQVGGDWYDAFLQRDGATVLVIGDVVGHDSVAAAAMGQLRSMLRAIAVHTGDGPAEVLAGTDHLLRALVVETTATAVVLRLEQSAEQREAGTTTLRWSNAGHPPPMVVTPEGDVTVLSAQDPDLLLGVDPGTDRSERTTTVGRDATVVLYTDGLVERRGQSLQVGLELLRAALADLARESLDLDALADALLERLLDGHAEDDVALVAVRLHRQDRPRPPEAGPQQVPPTVAPSPA